MNSDSQCNLMKAYLMKGKSFTKLKALGLFKSLNVGARIKDLRDGGMKITTTMIHTSDGKRVAEYSRT